MRDWLEVLVTESGLVVAQQTIERPPLMVAQMTEEWLNYYRKIAQSNTVPGTALQQLCHGGRASHFRTEQRKWKIREQLDQQQRIFRGE